MKSEDALTSAEVGKLWTAYMGNSMVSHVIGFYLRHVDDEDIRNVLEKAFTICKNAMGNSENILKGAGHPVPFGFKEQDVNKDAPRLFRDEFYLHYLKYVSKVGMSIYGIAIPLMTRRDTGEFFERLFLTTAELIVEINEVLEAKSLLTRPPIIPVPFKTQYAMKQSYLNGFFGEVRPLQALEIAHLHDNLENNSTSRTVLLGFAQVAQTKETRNYFIRGGEIAEKHYKAFADTLAKEHLPAPPMVAHLVTESKITPFSERLMMYHKVDMWAMRIRSYANSMAVSPRHDLAALYGGLMLEVGKYVEDGMDMMIDFGWFERPPEAADREELVFQ
ncbi:MAG TPA: DUF3231 family protein [Paenibacillus sp.]|nr:DUF3231 family protein [Paenibacillus sp.]